MERHDEYALAGHFDMEAWKRIFVYVLPYKKHIITLLVS